MIRSISHLSTSGVSSARRLPAVRQKKLTTCQCTSGRICFASQRSSLGSQDDQPFWPCERRDKNSTLKARVCSCGLPCLENEWAVRPSTNSVVFPANGRISDHSDPFRLYGNSTTHGSFLAIVTICPTTSIS